MSNPALVSFLANAGPVFITILGISFLKEKFNYIEIIGVVLTISGAVYISYNPGFEITENFNKALVLILVSNLLYALSIILSKKNIKFLPPSILSINRVIFIFLAAIIAFILTNQSFIINKSALLNIAIGSLFGPFLGTLASYNALKYIEASKASVVGSLKSLLVLITSYLYFGKLPFIYQIYGGILTIIGVLLISLGKIIKQKINNK
jgi:drug/metabolite transporter (DMT)-like permease